MHIGMHVHLYVLCVPVCICACMCSCIDVCLNVCVPAALVGNLLLNSYLLKLKTFLGCLFSPLLVGNVLVTHVSSMVYVIDGHLLITALPSLHFLHIAPLRKCPLITVSKLASGGCSFRNVLYSCKEILILFLSPTTLILI